MGKKLPADELELYQRCDEVLQYLWDPIGVAGAPSARDEYYFYLPDVFSLVRENAKAEVISAHLLRIETESIGLLGNEKKASEVAKVLLAWKVHIDSAYGAA